MYLATSNKDFKIKNGLIVQGANATVDGNAILTTAASIDDLADVSISSPEDTQILSYDASIDLWKNIDIPETVVSTTPPTDPAPTQGKQWFNSQSGKFYVYYDSYWVEISANKVGATGPVGSHTAGDGLTLTDETFAVDSTVVRENSSPTFDGLTNAKQKNALIASGYNSASGNFDHASRVVMTAVASGSTAPTTRPNGTALVAGDVWISF